MRRPTKRKLLMFASTVAACAVLFAAYWFTRPPELVWWTSPEIANTGRHIRVKLPDGWELEEQKFLDVKTVPVYGLYVRISFCARDGRPKFLRRLFPLRTEKTAYMKVSVFAGGNSARYEGRKSPIETGIADDNTGEWHYAGITVNGDGENISADVHYARQNLSAFKRTYKQICDSLTIE
jgi:hypothetical protein